MRHSLLKARHNVKFWPDLPEGNRSVLRHSLTLGCTKDVSWRTLRPRVLMFAQRRLDEL